MGEMKSGTQGLSQELLSSIGVLHTWELSSPSWLIHPAQHAVKTPENLYSELEVFRQEAMFGSGLFGFCLLALALGFLGRPGPAHNGKMHSESLQETVVPEPAQRLVSRIYDLIQPEESRDDRSCWRIG